MAAKGGAWGEGRPAPDAPNYEGDRGRDDISGDDKKRLGTSNTEGGASSGQRLQSELDQNKSARDKLKPDTSPDKPADGRPNYDPTATPDPRRTSGTPGRRPPGRPPSPLPDGQASSALSVAADTESAASGARCRAASPGPVVRLPAVQQPARVRRRASRAARSRVVAAGPVFRHPHVAPRRPPRYHPATPHRLLPCRCCRHGNRPQAARRNRKRTRSRAGIPPTSKAARASRTTSKAGRATLT